MCRSCRGGASFDVARNRVGRQHQRQQHTNNNSDAGGYLDTGSGSDESKMWPPTKLDWPPSDISTAGLSDSGKGSGDSGSDKTTPIVMPNGQAAPPADDASEDSESTLTSTTPTPIVPAGG